MPTDQIPTGHSDAQPASPESNSHWNPVESEATTHYGDSLDKDLRFVASPPAEIGTVLSAWSTERIGHAKDLDKLQWRGAFAGMVVGTLLALFVNWQFGLTHTNAMLCFAGFFLTFGISGWFIGKPQQMTSYVGTDGVAEFTYDQRRQAVIKSQIFLFEQAAHLRTQQTRHYQTQNQTRRYIQTSFSYSWSNTFGTSVYKIGDYHRSESDNPPRDSRYHLAIASEAAWSNYQLPRYVERLRQGEALIFPINGQNFIRLTLEEIELHVGRNRETFPLSELHALNIEEGHVTLVRENYRNGIVGIGRQGIFEFQYAQVANARLLLFLLEHLWGGTRPSSDLPRTSPFRQNYE